METARSAGVDDLSRLAELAAVGFDELTAQRGGSLWSRLEARRPPFEPSLRAALSDPGQHVVAGCLDDYVAGYAVLRVIPLSDGARLGVIDDLYVEPELRGVGIGEAMMGELLRLAAEGGCEGVESLALPGDRETKNFFESFGLVARAIRVYRPLSTAP